MKPAWLAATLAAGASAVASAAGLDTALGRTVLPRADAPALAVATSPRAHYVLHCAGCHGFDGAGSRAGQVPDMRRMGDFLRVPGGREFPFTLPNDGAYTVTFTAKDSSGASAQCFATAPMIVSAVRGCINDGVPPPKKREVTVRPGASAA